MSINCTYYILTDITYTFIMYVYVCIGQYIHFVRISIIYFVVCYLYVNNVCIHVLVYVYRPIR